MPQSAFFNIKDFGAAPDGKRACTEAFAGAVKAVCEAGGGTVYVPPGRYLTGPIRLTSNTTLYLDAGARLLFSRKAEDYPLVRSRWEGVEGMTYSPQLFGEGVENVTITGRGVLDGQGDYWWDLFREKRLLYPRPRLVGFQDSANILIEGVQMVNSPSWTINPIRCGNVTVSKVTIKNPADSPNTDGINPDSCRYVHISDCHLDVGDDCIAVKSGTEDCSLKVPSENIVIANCTMIHGHGGVVIGSEMSGGVRNVLISNCIFAGTDRGIRIKSRRGRGGVVEDLRANNIVMTGVTCPFVVNMYYFCGPGGKEGHVWDKSPYPPSEQTPVFRRIHFSNITVREARAAAGFIYGLPEMPVEEVTFTNVEISMVEDGPPEYPAMMGGLEPMRGKGFFCRNAKKVTFENVRISGQDGPGFLVESAENVAFLHCAPDGPESP